MNKSDMVNTNDKKNLPSPSIYKNDLIKKNKNEYENNLKLDDVVELTDALKVDDSEVEKTNLNLEENVIKPEKKYKQKDKDNIIIITTPQLKSMLKLCNSKSNRVSKEISPKVNQYFIEIILPEYLDTIEYKDDKFVFTEGDMIENKFLPSTKFNILALNFFNKKYPDFKIKFNKEKENFLKFQRSCELKLLNLIHCAQLLKEHCNRQTLHISDWYLAIKK